MATKNKFREDLYYRLNVANLRILPLRNRKEDITLLIQEFLPPGFTVHPEVLQYLQSYNWPGNVRELKNMLSYGSCLAEEKELRMEHLPEVMKNQMSESPQEKGTLKLITDRAEKNYISQMLTLHEKSKDGRKKVADLLGISLASLYNKMKKYGLE